jgi:hypothetical protein
MGGGGTRRALSASSLTIRSSGYVRMNQISDKYSFLILANIPVIHFAVLHATSILIITLIMDTNR